MFIGGVVAVTMETINNESVPVHSFGTTARWIVMYPVERLMPCTIIIMYYYSQPPSPAYMLCGIHFTCTITSSQPTVPLNYIVMMY